MGTSAVWLFSAARPCWSMAEEQQPAATVFVSLPSPVLADGQAWHPVVHLSFKLELTLTVWARDCAMLVLCREQEEERKK